MLLGPCADRFGGAHRRTFIVHRGTGWTTLAVTTFYLHPTDPAQFPGFLWSMLAMFFFSGLGNAGTFKQMPMIMPKRQAGGAIGFTAAIGSLGPFIVGVAIASLGTTAWFWISGHLLRRVRGHLLAALCPTGSPVPGLSSSIRRPPGPPVTD